MALFNEISSKDKRALFLFLIYVFECILIYVSPLFGFYLGLVLLAVIKFELYERIPLCILILISGALIYSSRMLGFVAGDDVYTQYFPLYINIQHGADIFDSKFGGGLEFGLALFFRLISNFGVRSYSEVLFCCTFLCLILFYIPLEGYLAKLVPKKDRSLFISSTLVFVGLLITTQILRQSVSSVFVIYALWFSSKRRLLISMFFLVLGSIFHLTALPIFLIFYILMYSDKKKITLLIVFFMTFSIMFGAIIKGIAGGGIAWAIQSKFLYYADNTQNGFTTAYYWRHLLVCFFMACFFKRDLKGEKFTPLLNLVVYGIFIYFSLIVIPFASDRILMPLTTYMLGSVIFCSFFKIKTVLKILVITYAIFRLVQLGPLYDTSCSSGIFCLWYSYPWLGSIF